MISIMKRQYRFARGKIIPVAIGIALIPAAAGAQAPAALAMTYDALGRVTQATYPGNVVVAFAYDAAGNRSSYTVTGSTNPPPLAPTPVGSMPVVPERAAADRSE